MDIIGFVLDNWFFIILGIVILNWLLDELLVYIDFIINARAFYSIKKNFEKKTSLKRNKKQEKIVLEKLKEAENLFNRLKGKEKEIIIPSKKRIGVKRYNELKKIFNIPKDEISK